MKTLNAKLIKDIGSQTITYKGAPLTVSWGGEWYTALHAGKVFRQCGMAELKKDISNGWNIDDVCTADDIADQLLQQELNLARMAKEAAAPHGTMMKTIINKKGNTGWQVTPWNTHSFQWSIADLVKKDHTSEAYVVNDIAYRIRELEIQSCGKKQMTATKKSDFIKTFLDPQTVLFATREDAAEFAENEFTKAFTKALVSAQEVIDRRAEEPAIYHFNEVGMARHEGSMKALKMAKALIEVGDINFRLEVQ